MAIDTGYIDEVTTFAERGAQTIYLTDGVRVRKTATEYVIERMKSDETWETIDLSERITPLPAAPTNLDEVIDLLVAYGLCEAAL